MGASSCRYVVFEFRLVEKEKYSGRVVFPPVNEFSDSATYANQVYDTCVRQVPNGRFMLVLFEKDRKTKEITWTVLKAQHNQGIPVDRLITAYQRKFSWRS